MHSSFLTFLELSNFSPNMDHGPFISYPNTFMESRKIINSFQEILFFIYLKVRNFPNFVFGEKTGTEQRWRSVNNFLKILDMKPISTRQHGTLVVWDQYLPENMKWTFGNMGLVCSKKILTVKVGTGKNEWMNELKSILERVENNWC